MFSFSFEINICMFQQILWVYRSWVASINSLKYRYYLFPYLKVYHFTILYKWQPQFSQKGIMFSCRGFNGFINLNQLHIHFF